MSTRNLCLEQKYKKYQIFFSENFPFLVVKFSIYLNRRVFIMFSRQQIDVIFLILPRKQDLTFQEMSNPIFLWGKNKNTISKCPLLKILPRVLRVKHHEREEVNYYIFISVNYKS